LHAIFIIVTYTIKSYAPTSHYRLAMSVTCIMGVGLQKYLNEVIFFPDASKQIWSSFWTWSFWDQGRP